MAALRNVAAVYYAHKDAKTPMYASFASIGLNIAMNATLMWVLGFMAFPLSTTVAAVLNIGILIALLPKKIGAYPLGNLLRFFGALTVASVAGGAAAWLLHRFLFEPLGSSFLIRAGSVAVCGAVALVLFYLFSRVLGIEEARDYGGRFLRK